MTAWSQRDPRWARKHLGTGQLTIGRVGCLLTCAAGVLAETGVGTDPDRLNRWLVANGGFVDQNLFIFASIEPFGVDLVDLIFCPTTPAPVAALAEHLARGRHVIVKVDFQPGATVQPHWVRLLNVTDGAILDPWQLPGDEATTLDTYYAPGWTAARAIMAAAVYAPVARLVTAHAAFAAELAQPTLCLRTPEAN